MKKLLALSLIMAAAALNAYTPPGVVLPEPQKVITKAQKIPLAGAIKISYWLDPNYSNVIHIAFSKLNSSLTSDAHAMGGKKLVVLAGIAGGEFDSEISGYNLDVPELPEQGYALRLVSEDDDAESVTIVVVGADQRGVFYGLMTLKQMILVEDGKLYLNYSDIDDYPVWKHRFVSDDVISGNFESYMKLAEWKISGFATGIGRVWRDPAKRNHFENLFKEMKMAKDTGLMDFMLLVHLYGAPMASGNFSAANEEDIQELIEFCRLAASYKIDHIWIMADDSTPRRDGGFAAYNKEEDEMFGGSIGRAHGYIMKRLYEALHDEFPALQLSMCPAAYSLYFHEIATNPKMEKYARDWAEQAPPEVRWVWTGTEVTTYNVTRKDADHQRSYLKGHELYLFDNSNCRTPPLSIWDTGYYEGMADNDGSVVYLNTRIFTWPEENPFCLAANSYWWNPGKFDVEETYNKAIEVRFGANTAKPFMRLHDALIAAGEVVEAGVATDDFKGILAELKEADKEAGAAGIETGRTRNIIKGCEEFISIKRPSLEVPSATAKPALDGLLDDEAWKNAAVIPLTPRSGKPTSIPAEGYITYMADGVYLAFRMAVPEGGLPPIEKMPHDRPIFAHPDCLDIFIQPTPGGKVIQFTVDYAGNSYDNLDGDPIHNFDFPRAVHVGEKEWTCEIFIPALELEGIQARKPAPGQSWLANFHRNCNKANEQQSWGIGGGFSSTAYFGTLVFK